MDWLSGAETKIS